MFQLLPYGATINLTCTSCSKKGKKIDNYTDSEHYTIIEDDLGKNNNYFLTSDREPIEMTYSYTAKNGILVGIETNLQIKNKNLGSNGAGSFTISNENWFNNQNKPTPYIKLLFNKVKVECCFVNPFGADDPGYGSNGWSGLQNGGDEFFIPYSLNNNNTSSCKLKRYITVSWSTSEDNENMCLEINKGNSGYWFQGWFSYGDTNGNIYSFDHHKDSSLTKPRLWNDYNGIP